MDQPTASAHPAYDAGLRFAPRIATNGGYCTAAELADGTLAQLDPALSQLAAWRRQGHQFPLSIALDHAELHAPDLAVRVQLLLLKWLVPPAMLELRLPAGVAAATVGDTRAQLRRLAVAGVRFAADHRLGEEIAPLLRLRIGAVRLDFRDLEQSGLARGSLDEALIALRAELGWTLVALDPDCGSADLVARCDEVTGPPLAPAPFETWLDSFRAECAKKAAA